MRILVSNDDGYSAPGLRSLIKVLKPFGELLVVAPKTAQSGMSMAVTMGLKPIAVKNVGEIDGVQTWYLDGTPASCVKFGLDNIMSPLKPDIVISGINHGSNAATASLYSGTVGAAMEGAVNGIPAIGLSIDDFSPDACFDGAEAVLPSLFGKLIPAILHSRKGIYYNINIPNLPAEKIKGVKVCTMGLGHWVDEYKDYGKFLRQSGHEPCRADIDYCRDKESGEDIYVMAGDFTSDPSNVDTADHLQLARGYVTVVPQWIQNTDKEEFDRLCDIIL